MGVRFIVAFCTMPPGLIFSIDLSPEKRSDEFLFRLANRVEAGSRGLEVSLSGV